jgi:Tfp pilus assembly protein PilF
LGQKDKAFDEFELAIIFDPRNARAHYNLATLLVERRQFDQARRTWSRRTAQIPKMPT